MKACGTTQNADMGNKVHEYIAIEGTVEQSCRAWQCLGPHVSRYGVLQKAREEHSCPGYGLLGRHTNLKMEKN